MSAHLECLDGPEGCRGEVEYRTTPDRDDFKAFPRCVAHFEQRLRTSKHILELTSPVPPRWFDPLAAGERWEED